MVVALPWVVCTIWLSDDAKILRVARGAVIDEYAVAVGGVGRCATRSHAAQRVVGRGRGAVVGQVPSIVGESSLQNAMTIHACDCAPYYTDTHSNGQEVRFVAWLGYNALSIHYICIHQPGPHAYLHSAVI